MDICLAFPRRGFILFGGMVVEMKPIVFGLLMCSFIFATQWQQPEPIYGLEEGGFNLNSDNTIMYGAKWHDGYWMGDCCYYIWNGSTWVWYNWVQGDVNSTEYDIEPFITYDGQHLYFERWNSNHALYVADWNGSAFVNSSPLNYYINQGSSRYPCLTQDSQFLYGILN